MTEKLIPPDVFSNVDQYEEAFLDLVIEPEFVCFLEKYIDYAMQAKANSDYVSLSFAMQRITSFVFTKFFRAYLDQSEVDREKRKRVEKFFDEYTDDYSDFISGGPERKFSEQFLARLPIGNRTGIGLSKSQIRASALWAAAEKLRHHSGNPKITKIRVCEIASKALIAGGDEISINGLRAWYRNNEKVIDDLNILLKLTAERSESSAQAILDQISTNAPIDPPRRRLNIDWEELLLKPSS